MLWTFFLKWNHQIFAGNVKIHRNFQLNATNFVKHLGKWPGITKKLNVYCTLAFSYDGSKVVSSWPKRAQEAH